MTRHDDQILMHRWLITRRNGNVMDLPVSCHGENMGKLAT